MKQFIRVVIVSLSLCRVFSLWHAYSSSKSMTECTASDDERALYTAKLSGQEKENWKLWPEVVSQRDKIDGETLYGFKTGMEEIWINQHPTDCSKAKFLISGGFESGFGSEMHVIGAGLALAMSMNRVYIMLADRGDSSLMDKMHSSNKFHVDNDYCRNQTKLNLDCYYEPWSSCTLHDALKGTTLQTLRQAKLFLPFNELKGHKNRTEKTLVVHLAPELADEIPPKLQQVVKCSPMRPEQYKYWWRAVSVAYLMRPNEPTRELIMQHRQDKEMVFDKEAQQCVSVHIRRGDKHLEMKVIDDEKVFYDTAQQLWTNLKNTTSSTQNKGVMFVGSEDPAAMDTALAWGLANNFDIKYSNLFDRKQVSTRLNATEQEIAHKKGEFMHNEWEYFNMILTLDGHLRCRAFVCTQRSNYCRLIDELRATVGEKLNKQYADFSCHGGQPIPCIDSQLTGIGW